MTEDELRVSVSVKRLEAMAAYYEFPLAAFFGGKIPKGRTRLDALRKAQIRYTRIRDLVDEWEEEDEAERG